jgi:hypothetical protein
MESSKEPADRAPRDADLRDLVRTAWTEHGLRRVDAQVLQFPAEANRWTAVVQATVETERGSFAALGEATDGLTSAEDRALARALAWATNRLEAPASNRDAQRPAEKVPAFLAAEPEAPAASPPDSTEPASVAPPAQPARGGGRVYTTAQSLAKACSNLGLSAPEPEPDWDEARLQAYVDTWSAELRRARAGPTARTRNNTVA